MKSIKTGTKRLPTVVHVQLQLSTAVLAEEDIVVAEELAEDSSLYFIDLWIALGQSEGKRGLKDNIISPKINITKCCC